MKTHDNLFTQIISLENLFLSWQEFKYGKRRKPDVQLFERNLEDNIFNLHEELKNKTYRHANYSSFFITDPKVRHIHKAKVWDRIVHHAIYRVLYPLYDKTFIFDSYSCRINKGTHRAVIRLEKFTRHMSKNYTKPCCALKCDVKKFFDSIDHEVLFQIIKRKIKDTDTLWLLWEIICSYSVSNNNAIQPSLFESFSAQPELERERERERESKSACGRGLPIGNLTSQLFANVYLNKLDQFIKHGLKIKYYLRYCDDFVILENDPTNLEKIIGKIRDFLGRELKLSLHENKVGIRKLRQGIDFLGYVVLPHYRVLRTGTKKRILKKVCLRRADFSENKISERSLDQSIQSYLGVVKHCKGYKIEKQIKKIIGDRDDRLLTAFNNGCYVLI